MGLQVTAFTLSLFIWWCAFPWGVYVDPDGHVHSADSPSYMPPWKGLPVYVQRPGEFDHNCTVSAVTQDGCPVTLKIWVDYRLIDYGPLLKQQAESGMDLADRFYQANLVVGSAYSQAVSAFTYKELVRSPGLLENQLAQLDLVQPATSATSGLELTKRPAATSITGTIR